MVWEHRRGGAQGTGSYWGGLFPWREGCKKVTARPGRDCVFWVSGCVSLCLSTVQQQLETSGEPHPPSVYLRHLLLRNLSIMLAVEERYLKEFCHHRAGIERCVWNWDAINDDWQSYLTSIYLWSTLSPMSLTVCVTLSFCDPLVCPLCCPLSLVVTHLFSFSV